MRRLAPIAFVLLLLTGCGATPTKEDLLAKAEKIHRRAELEKALGKPHDITKLGPVETWIYKASNGQVVFVVIGDKVTLQAAGSLQKK